MSDTPKPGNIMSEPIPTANSGNVPHGEEPDLDAAVARLNRAADEAVAAARDIVRARPFAVAASAAAAGLLLGLLCHRRD